MNSTLKLGYSEILLKQLFKIWDASLKLAIEYPDLQSWNVGNTELVEKKFSS